MLTYDSAIVPVAERVQSVAPSNKALSGTTAWGTTDTPIASGMEQYQDFMRLLGVLMSAQNGNSTGLRYRFLMPPEQYALMATTEFGVFDRQKVLDRVLEHSAVESVMSWYACAAAESAGALSSNTIMGFIPDVDTATHLTSMEWTPMAPQLVNMSYKVNTVAETGGGLIRRQFQARYMRGI